MGHSLSAQAWPGTRWRAGVWPDVAAGAALTLAGQLELASSSRSGWHGLLQGMLLFVQTAPVAARRVAAAWAATVAATALAAEALATTPTNTLSGLLAGLVLLYGLGRYSHGWRLIAVTAFAVAALGVHMLRLPGSHVSDLAFAVIFSTAVWLVGRTLRRRESDARRAEADALAQRETAAAERAAAVAEERSRIVRELHDVVAHGMGVMVVQAGAAEQLLDSDPAAAREPLMTVRQTGQGALAEMRRLLGLLRTGDEGSDSEPQPGLDQLPALVERLRKAGMPVTITTAGTPGIVPPGIQLCAYRIVQEALTNSLKHAPRAATEVALNYSPGGLALRVRNDKARASVEPVDDGMGHGLVGMRERVRIYGGTVRAAVEPDGSFLVDAFLPYQTRPMTA